VRARSHSVKIIQEFRKQGIDYEAREIDELQNEQHILDVLALARAILHAGDRLSWLACLRAPWCGLTLADLSALAEGQPRRIVLELLHDPDRIGAMSIDGRLRAVRTGEILEAAVRQVGRHPIRKIVESAWVTLGGPATLTHPSQFDDVEVMLGLLEEFDEGGMIRDFSLLNERLKYLYAKPQTGGERVQIMTIHAAKGLQFDAVLIPHLYSPFRQEDRGLLAWIERRNSDGELGVLVAGQGQTGDPDPLYKFVSTEMKKKQEYEEQRLLYVAATRAKSFLYLSANLAKNKQETSFAAPQGFLKLFWAEAEAAFQTAWEDFIQSRQVQQVLPFSSMPQTLLRRLAATWEAPKQALAISISAPSPRNIASSRQITYEWVGDVARHVGTVVHEYLRRFADEGLDQWSAGRVVSARPLVESELRRFGTPRSELTAASERVIRALQNVLKSDRARWILSPAEGAQSEWAISGILEGRLFHTVVDRSLIDSQNRRWIVDFKTSDHAGGSLTGFLDEEQRRHALQMATYASLLRLREERPIMLGLHFPLLDAWREWAFEDQEVAATAKSLL
jgi:ATP-dependent helicase/nuclease subunit A